VWSASRPGRLYPRERPGTHCTGGWVGPGAGLDRCGKSRLTGIRFPDPPARSESLYRLRYPGSHFVSRNGKIVDKKLQQLNKHYNTKCTHYSWGCVMSFGDERTTSSVYIRYERFLARVVKKMKVEIDSPVSSGYQRKCMKYVSFPCPPLAAARSILTLAFFC
jgi:hypothetical protein